MKGMPLDYNELKKIEKKYKIPIVIDSAEFFGAKYKGKYVGSQMLAHTFSFFANKNLTTGEGGMVVTNNKKIFDKLIILRNQGQISRYKHVELGNNFRMIDLCASIGIEQLKKLKKNIQKKNKIAKFYNKYLKKNHFITTPCVSKFVTQHSWYNYCIRVPARKRDALIDYLKKKKLKLEFLSHLYTYNHIM